MIGRGSDVVARASFWLQAAGGAFCRNIPPKLIAYPCYAIQLRKLSLTYCNFLTVLARIGRILEISMTETILAWLRPIKP